MKRRVAIAIACGLWGGALAFAFMARPGFYGDFLAFWYAARSWLAGADPYLVTPSAPPYNIDDRFFYPFPALIAVAPFARLPLPLAGAAFFGVSSALLGLAITRDGYGRLPLFASFPFVMAASLGQWAPLVLAAALLPGTGFLAVCKPNLALAMAIARPTRSIIFGGAVFLLVTLAFDPHWPVKWLANLRTMEGHPPPLASLWGVWLVLAVARWRTVEGRLVLGMACVPQMPMFADQLPLLLVGTTRRQAIVAAIASHIAGFAWIWTMRPGEHPSSRALPFVLAGTYLPALVMILRRPSAHGVNDTLREIPIPPAGNEVEKW